MPRGEDEGGRRGVDRASASRSTGAARRVRAAMPSRRARRASARRWPSSPPTSEQVQRRVAPREPDEPFQQQVEVLVALGVADEEQVGPRDAEGLLHERRGLAGRPRAEELLDAVRDDLDPRARRGNWRRISRSEACETVITRAAAAHRAADHQPGVEPRQAAVLARRQVDDVVNGHHRRAGQAQRQHVVRRVVEVEAQLARLRGERGQLAERVASGALGHQPDPIARREQPLVAGAVEEDPLGRAVEAHQPLHEVAHVRADAVVGRLARVDADAHATPHAPAPSRRERRSCAGGLPVDLEHPPGGAVPGETGGAGEAPLAHRRAALRGGGDLGDPAREQRRVAGGEQLARRRRRPRAATRRPRRAPASRRPSPRARRGRSPRTARGRPRGRRRGRATAGPRRGRSRAAGPPGRGPRRRTAAAISAPRQPAPPASASWNAGPCGYSRRKISKASTRSGMFLRGSKTLTKSR